MKRACVFSLPVFLCVPLVLTLAAASAAAHDLAGRGPGPIQPSAMAGFGAAVAVGEDVVFVGEPDNLMRPGIVYVYRRNATGEWTEQAQLTASDGAIGDGFGAALALEGGTLLVGAVDQNGGRGAVYVFRRDGDTWRQAARLTATDGAEDDGFGAALALEGDVALIGAPGRQDRTGSVYVFQREAEGTWSAGGELQASDAAADAAFGAALALEDGTALIAAPIKDNQTGAVYAFQLEGGAWEEASVLEVDQDEVVPGTAFGSALALHDGVALVGAPGWANATGAILSFRRDEAGAWQPAGRLLAFDGASRHLFGVAIAPTDEALWVGAPGADDARGAIYVFEQGEAAGEWSSARKLVADGIESRDRFAGTLAASGGVAVVGVVGADHGAGTAVVFEDGEATGLWTQGNTLLSEAEELDPVVGGAVECQDGTAAVFDCSNIELLSFLPISALGGERGINLNDIWGWTDPESGKEYALVGRIDGTAFVDISDPVNPVYVGEVLKTPGSPASSWRDIKVYEDHAYIVADNAEAHGMQIFDLTRLREYEGEPIAWEPDTTYHRIHSAHNIAINTETGFAYPIGNSSGGETCGGGLHMIDIRQPENPEFAGCFADPQTGRASTGYSHDAQCVVYHGPDQDYQGREICFGYNETAISIADVTDKDNPVAITRVSYPNVAYTHQGWITPDHRYIYVDDEGDEISGVVPATRTLIWDIVDLDDPQLVAQHLGKTAASDHNLYIKGDLMYQSNYGAGLQILDISDRENPVQVGHIDTAPFGEDDPGYTGTWSNYPFFESGVIAVTSIEYGLFLVRVEPEEATS